MTYVPADDRYERMPYSRCGRSGLLLPAISLGLWQNFGGDRPLETSRAIVRRAFDLGITHFDLANNYGPPYGSAEETFGAPPAHGPRALPRRARDLDQGRLRHVARPLRRLRLAQVPAREPRPEPAAHGPRLRRHLLLAPARPRRRRWRRRSARSTPPCGRARRCTPASRPTRRSAPPQAADDPARARHAAAHPPAVVLDAQPLDRARPARRARRARASAASSSRRSPRACSPTATWTASRPTRAPAARARSRPTCSASRRSRRSARSTRSPRGAARRSRRWRWPGRCATRA